MSEDWEGRSAQELEGLLREELGRVSLVGELELDPDSHLYGMALGVVNRSLVGRGVNRFDWLSTRCPAALSVVLVADGIFGYEGGEYWPNIALDVTGANESSRLGQQFEKSLDLLGLERFESARRSEGALRYVMPILLHGKFPRYCALDLWRLLVDELRRGAGSADELLSSWVRRPSVLVHVDKPVQRFLDKVRTKDSVRSIRFCTLNQQCDLVNRGDSSRRLHSTVCISFRCRRGIGRCGQS